VITDFLDVTSIILAFVFFPLFFVRFNKEILDTFNRAKNVFLLKRRHLILFSIKSGYFFFYSKFLREILKKINPSRVFVVDREVFFPVIHACKKLGIPVFELQHGISLGWNALYSGKYDEMLDPDWFLTFGKYWKGRQFGMPLDKIINIGWAYSKMLDELQDTEKLKHDAVLVISEPSRSHEIFNATEALAFAFPEVEFHIRLHPQEQYPDSLMGRLKNCDNIKMVNNQIESSVAILEYEAVLGINSSVLYEALSLRREVGCFDFCGCEAIVAKKFHPSPFFILKKPDDFTDFRNSADGIDISDNRFYSEFNSEFFNKTILHTH